ncbi:RICIN domain-containing protein [Nonomuraea sp. NPDC050404]|uniref:RICIN domain-containing protein n=1 Tax=Nonomuraea sp. NPDC050404 TaxID=3155783 RepID=UPI0033FA5AFA
MRSAVAALAITASLAATLSFATAPASAEPNRDLINKSSGGRLALLNNSTAEGATAITLRSPSWKYTTEEWETTLSAWQADEPNTYTATIRNQAANKCLQPASATAERGTTIVVRTCNGSELQKWSMFSEKVGDQHTTWWIWRPMVNKNVAMALNRYNDGSWDTLHLDTAYPSNDRLWRARPNDAP